MSFTGWRKALENTPLKKELFYGFPKVKGRFGKDKLTPESLSPDAAME